MISEKIDLTENRDFRGFSSIHLTLPLVDDEGKMTSEDYESLLRWEKIFGKRRHDNEKLLVFGILDFIRERERHCDRCGEVILPWKERCSGLCKKCEEDLDLQFRGRLPWKAEQTTSSNTIDSNLFNLR